jgi:hypothetical protein
MVTVRMANEIDGIMQFPLGSFYEMDGKRVWTRVPPVDENGTLDFDFGYVSYWDSGGMLRCLLKQREFQN